jgi:hypothetical protein
LEDREKEVEQVEHDIDSQESVDDPPMELADCDAQEKGTNCDANQRRTDDVD